MCGLVVSAFVLSLLGAIAQRALAAACGVPARLVLGIGPALGRRGQGAPERAIEVRAVMVWAWIALGRGGSVAARIAVRALGPIVIVLVPYLVLATAIGAHGVPDDAPADAMLVGAVTAESPAMRAGIREGDAIVAVAGSPVHDVGEVSVALQERDGVATPIVVERDGARRTLEVVPEASDSGRAVIGVTAAERRRAARPGEALALAARMIVARIALIVAPSREPADAIGPVAIARHVRAHEVDGALRIALLAASWGAVAVLWAAIAAISEIVRAIRRTS